jgi:hypothetical protein
MQISMSERTYEKRAPEVDRGHEPEILGQFPIE